MALTQEALKNSVVVGGKYNVVSDYRWTLTGNLDKQSADTFDETPYVIVREFQVDESTIKRQWEFYTTAAGDFAKATSTDPLKPYEALFSRTSPACTYKFPYFSDVNFEVNSQQWASLDTLEAGKKFAAGTMGFLFGEGAAAMTTSIIEGAGTAAGAALALTYPKVGIMDRPKLWQSHDFRTIEIKFPLFNTVAEDDWKRNRTLIWVILNNSLFVKRDFITGIPPVYYEILIPGQHYSFAACMTNFTVYNRGNMRKLKDVNGKDAIVPDAYEVSMTFTDLVMPSRNLFRAIQSQQDKVTVEAGIPQNIGAII
jgi:hypothetical protein